MKLLNHTLLYLSVSLLAVLGLWALIFYFNMLEEVKDSIDDGLANYKMLIIYKAQKDTSMLSSAAFGAENYTIREIAPSYAIQVRDSYKDSLLYSERLNSYEPVRLLTTAFAAEDGRFYELKIISAAVNKAELIRKLLLSLTVLYMLMLASIIAINNFVLKRIWRPFYYLLNQLKKFRLANATLFRPATTTVTEFRELNDTLLSLLGRNLDTFISQKQFIENASHELQTPVAISINKLELLAERNTLSEEDVQTVAAVIQTLESLKRMNRSLLLLSKIENQQFAAEEKVNLNEVIKKMVSDFSDLSEFKEVQLLLLEDGQFDHVMNKDLAEMLVMNLLKNAIVHNRPNGTVTISISHSSFTIENTGEAAPLDPVKMFDRFYKKTADRTSTGLGLAIVKAITHFYGFSIEYHFSGNHVFRVGVTGQGS
ncbi:sensor histidine kinase [Longitalea luteola]|uniref:sensor histidine kinase n=1 Tax=Longitalea luteola TaxID=2812563 RepID=UPI001A971E01|nr:HAMP domain-containing sensor histidine kinase [Longitalea luteola]